MDTSNVSDSNGIISAKVDEGVTNTSSLPAAETVAAQQSSEGAEHEEDAEGEVDESVVENVAAVTATNSVAPVLDHADDAGKVEQLQPTVAGVTSETPVDTADIVSASVKEEPQVLSSATDTAKASVDASGNDEEEDMNVGSDDLATPPPREIQPAAVASATTTKMEESLTAPAATISGTATVAAPAIAKTESSTSNGDAASVFLKQTFDSFSKTHGSVPSRPAAASINKNDPEEYRKSLLRRVEKDRRDGEAWLALISDTNSKADLQEIRKIYEDFFLVFPNAARQWQDYAAMELANSEFEKVESIFTRCLRSTPSTDLWRFYLSYTRRVNPLPPPSKGPTSGDDSEREKVRKVIEGAYDFALRFIGQSRDAGEVWRDYLLLLKEREAGNQWQSGQKMDDIRRAYQRAVAVPLANVELIWREYDAYENGLNRITAKKFLAERSPAYMTARTVFREMKTLTDGLYRPIISKVPSWAAPPSLSPIVSPLTIARDRSQVEAWRKYLQWEEGNPLQLEDAQTQQSRVLLAYRKATMHLRFFPEIWYMASNYCLRTDRPDEAVTWLKSGMEACSGSFLLHFAYVELAERRSQVEDCGAVFDALLEWVHSQIEEMQANLEESIKLIGEEGERLKAEASARRRDEGAADVVEGEEREELRKMEEEREKRKEIEREKVRPKIEEMKEHASLVWIKYMHFVRRQEGQRPSRAIFARARKSKFCTWQVYEANALMEYHCSKEVSVATKVFELALKTYGSDEAFVVRYLDFLLSINDDNNARALFERTVSTFPPERARPIWDRWSEYEYSFGDLASIAKIDERLAQVYPDEPAVKRLVDRNSYMDLDVVGPRDLGLRTVINGSSAAERAVAASREIAQEAAGSASTMQNIPTGPSGRGFSSIEEDSQSQQANKRARVGVRDGLSPVPPTGPRNAIPPPRGVKRSVSPPSRFVPPPRGEPPTGPAAGPHATHQHQAPYIQQQPQQAQHTPPPPQYIEIPDGVLYFLDCLPSASTFDGPRLSADDIIESLQRSSLPHYDASKATLGGGFGIPSGPAGGPMRRMQRGGMGRNRRF